MTVLMVPATDAEPWPTLGPQVCQFIEQNLVFGPGDLRGEPARLDAEKRAFVWRLYEVYPQGHEFAGRRRFKRVAISLRKGTAKTELAAWIAACELHHEGPVRCDGFDRRGDPMGAPVHDPYVALVAYDEEQTALLAYGALKSILEGSRIASDFDIGLERITRRRGDGRAEALASSPNARDGARTTFQHFDETHRFVLYKLKRTHSTMLANVTKRREADGWSLETTTAFEPGAKSIAEETMEYARAVSEKRAAGRDFFFYHRGASDDHDLNTEEGARAALLEASGSMAAWADIESTMSLYHDPNYSRDDFERFFLNRMVKSSAKAFDPSQWAKLVNVGYAIPDGALVTLGFDGALFNDSTGLVATELATGFQQVVGVWEKPFGPAGEGWQVPEQEVDDAVAAAFQRWAVWRLYCDPPYWQSWVSQWASRHGVGKVVEWWTNRRTQMTHALEAYQTAIRTAALSHDGHAVMARHIANAYRQDLRQLDEQGKPLYLIRKERSDSPNKIDLAMAGVLSWRAFLDAIATGETGKSVYEERGIITIG